MKRARRRSGPASLRLLKGKKTSTGSCTEMDKENPDINALAGLMKERAQNIPDMVSKPIDLFVNFYNLLDKDQQAR